jgi:hypothetical protein
VIDDAAMLRGEVARAPRRFERLADAYEREGACLTRAFDDLGAISVEGRVGEMDVAIDESGHGSTNRRAGRRLRLLPDAPSAP